MNNFWHSVAFRLATDPGFFVPYFLILGAVGIELIRRGTTRDRRQRRRVALALYSLLVVLVAALFLALKPPSAYYDPYQDEEIENVLGVRFGERIELVGYTIVDPTIRPGKSVHVRLYWRSTGHIPVDYHTFIHLVDADGAMVVQGDRPAGGTLSATYWLPGELIEDQYSLTLPDDAPPGEYTIIVGLYQWWDGTRLRAELEGERVPDDAVSLSESVYVMED